MIVLFAFSLMQCGQICMANFENVDGEFICYSVSLDVFRKFLENPSVDILQNSLKCIYSKSVKENKIDYAYMYEDGRTQKGSASSGSLRLLLISFPLEIEFVEYVSSKENIEKILSENGIDCNINYYVTLTEKTEFVPVTIWASTDKGNYFITVNLTSTGKPHKYEYEFTVYSQSEFYEAFRQKDGICIVDDVTIPVTFEYTRVYLPFRKVLETMGSTVTWDQKRQTAFFTTPNGLYAVNMIDHPILVEATDTETINYGFTSYGVILPYVKNINGSIMIDYEFMQQIAEVFNAETSIDMESLTVTISTK